VVGGLNVSLAIGAHGRSTSGEAAMMNCMTGMSGMGWMTAAWGLLWQPLVVPAGLGNFALDKHISRKAS
jgi:hypothetical protein